MSKVIAQTMKKKVSKIFIIYNSVARMTIRATLAKLALPFFGEVTCRILVVLPNVSKASFGTAWTKDETRAVFSTLEFTVCMP